MLEASLDRLRGDRGRFRGPQSPVYNEQEAKILQELLELVKKREYEIARLKELINEHKATVHSLQDQVEGARNHGNSSSPQDFDGITRIRIFHDTDQNHSFYLSQLNLEVKEREAEVKRYKEAVESYERGEKTLKKELEHKEKESEMKLEESEGKVKKLIEERDHWKKLAEKLEDCRSFEPRRNARVGLSPSRVPRRFIPGEGIRRLTQAEMSQEEARLRYVDVVAGIEEGQPEPVQHNHRESGPGDVDNSDLYGYGHRVGSRIHGPDRHRHNHH